MDNSALDWPQPLSARDKEGFAYATIKDRLPVIVTKTIDVVYRKRRALVDMGLVDQNNKQKAEEETKEVISRIAKLRNELQTNKPVIELVSSSEDICLWNDYIKEWQRQHSKEALWFDAPWLYVECYLYRRIRESFELSTYIQGFDPFEEQKQESLRTSLDAAEILANYLEELFADNNLFNDNSRLKNEFVKLIEVSLWGNKCDLSLSAGVQNSQKTNPLNTLQSMRAKILSNEVEELWNWINSLTGSKKSFKLAIILDNAGFELVTDLILADFLLRSGIMSDSLIVNFYVKKIPWFVSDTMKKDFIWTIKYLGDSKFPVLKRLSERWSGYLSSGKWKIIEDCFWTLPHDFNDMKSVASDLYNQLSDADLVLFKGDLNYRKLVGDLNWSFKVPLKTALKSFLPTTIAVLRTIKADVVCGITDKSVIKEIEEKKLPIDWMTTGDFALIQVVIK